MTLTLAEERRLAALSDGPLLSEAVRFAGENGALEDAQLNGLRQYAEDWSELMTFVRKQAARDSWSGRQRHYKTYYLALQRKLEELSRRDAVPFVETTLSPAERRVAEARYAALIAREFIQHLWAETLFARRAPSKG